MPGGTSNHKSGVLDDNSSQKTARHATRLGHPARIERLVALTGLGYGGTASVKITKCFRPDFLRPRRPKCYGDSNTEG